MLMLQSPGFCSYVGGPLPAGITPAHATSNHVLAYEPPANHAGHGADGMNVLYGDGHVDWVPEPEAARVIAELQAGFNPPRPARPASP